MSAGIFWVVGVSGHLLWEGGDGWRYILVEWGLGGHLLWVGGGGWRWVEVYFGSVG